MPNVPLKKSEQDLKFETATKRLADEAVRRLSADNVTVVVVAIGKFTKNYHKQFTNS